MTCGGEKGPRAPCTTAPRTMHRAPCSVQRVRVKGGEMDARGYCVQVMQGAAGMEGSSRRLKACSAMNDSID